MRHQAATKLYQRLIEKELMALEKNKEADVPELRRLFQLAETHHAGLTRSKQGPGKVRTFTRITRYGNHHQRYTLDENWRVVLLFGGISGYEYATLMKPLSNYPIVLNGSFGRCLDSG